MNKDFFENIDTEQKAYILGFLYADGYFSTKNNRIGVNLSIKDLKLLEEISIILTGENKVKATDYFIKNKPIIKGRVINCGKIIKLSFSNKKMAQDLKNTGNESPKSLNLTFPIGLPENLYNHFIRGYFDGDGCLCIKNNSQNNVKRAELSMLSSLTFCESIQKIINEKFNIQAKIKTKGKIYQISTQGNRQCEKILDWIYENATIKLERKYQKYLEFKKLVQKCKDRYKNSSSQFNNIFFDKSRQKWTAMIRINNKKTKYLGRFLTEIEAFNFQQKYINENATRIQNPHHLKTSPIPDA